MGAQGNGLLLNRVVSNFSRSITMHATFNRSGNKSYITLEGDLTLPHADALKGVFTKALQESDDVSIAIVTVEKLDLSCLQLMCSAHRSAMRSKKKVSFIGSPPQAFNDAAEAAGFARGAAGCKLDDGYSCLWMTVKGDRHE
jgi:ABC-type transporter Mla MlaB component